MLPQNSDWASAQKVKRKVRKRVLKGCLDVAIMAQLSERRVLSATNIISILEKRYNIQLSAGTVYPVLYALERDGKINRVPYYRAKRLFVLTSKGREEIKYFQTNSFCLHEMLEEIFGNKEQK